jgi:hypothetical protein
MLRAQNSGVKNRKKELALEIQVLGGKEEYVIR